MSTDLIVPSQEHSQDDASLLDICPQSFIPHIKAVPEEWLLLSESELLEFVFSAKPVGRPSKHSIFQTTEQIRALFWLEHEIAVTQHRRMNAPNVFSDVMTRSSFYGAFLPNPKRVAWMIYPFGSHMADVSIMLKTARNKMAEILALPAMRKICRCHWECVCYGKRSHQRITADMLEPCSCKPNCRCPEVVDHKTIDVQTKIFEKLELRARGSVPQVINQRTLSLNVNKNIPSQKEAPELPSSMEEIDKRLKELEAVTNTPSLPPSQEVANVIEASVLLVSDEDEL